MQKSYGTLSQTIDGLKKEGYTLDFNVKKHLLQFQLLGPLLSPEDFEIDFVYRFEGASDPDDQSILYAISSSRFHVKGVLVNGYGIYADDRTNEILEGLNTHQLAL